MNNDLNTLDFLKEIMQERKWHKGLVGKPNEAGVYKSLAKNNKLSHEKASEILEILGYRKVKNEVWEKMGDNFR